MIQKGQRQWALVTGATSGIGRQLALTLAGHGFNVVPVGRRPEALEEVAELIRRQGVEALAIRQDLTDPAAAASIASQLAAAGITIDFLANDAGFGSQGAFLDADLTRLQQMVDLNVKAVMALTYVIGRSMRDRGQGRILNISSVTGLLPGPYMAVYHATKAFVESFSEALAQELAGTGVTVTSYCPGPTATGFHDNAGIDNSRLGALYRPADAAAVARQAYRAAMQGRTVRYGGAGTALTAFGVRLAPRRLVGRIMAAVNVRRGGRGQR